MTTAESPKDEFISGLCESDRWALDRVDALLGVPEGLHRLEPITTQLRALRWELNQQHSSSWLYAVDRFCAAAQPYLDGKRDQPNTRLFSPTETASNPFHGILSTYPLYPIFFYQCENADLKPAYFRLLKTILFSRIRACERGHQYWFNEFNHRELNTASIACRLVRKLHKDEADASTILTRIDDYSSYITALVDWIRRGCQMGNDRYKDGFLDQVHYNELRQLGQFLAECHGLSTVIGTRARASFRKGFSRSHDRVNLALWDWRKHEVSADVTDDIEHSDTGLELRRLNTPVPEDSKRDLSEAGLIPGEFHEDTEFWVGILHSGEGSLAVDEDEEEETARGKGEIETGLPPFAKYFTAAKNRAMKFAFDNQRTATRWSRLTMAENAQFMRAVDDAFKDASAIATDANRFVSERQEAERVRDLCLALGLMIALGRGYESIRALFVIGSEDEWDPETMEVAYLKRERRWLGSTTSLGYRWASPPEQQRWFQPVQPRV